MQCVCYLRFECLRAPRGERGGRRFFRLLLRSSALSFSLVMDFSQIRLLCITAPMQRKKDEKTFAEMKEALKEFIK